MKYYLYRIKIEEYEKLKDIKSIPLQFLPIALNQDDKIIIFISKEMKIIGEYKKEQDNLIQIKQINKNLKDYYDKFSFISYVNDRIYKKFSKRILEIKKQDYKSII